MGRIYFPTRNDNGVRDLSKSVTLGNYLYTDYRAPAEPAAKAAMNPVNLGSLSAFPNYMVRYAPPVRVPAPPNVGDHIFVGPSPIPQGPAPFRYGPSPAQPSFNPPPVSSQSSPTPQVTVPELPPPPAVLVTSGGGTASPAAAPAVNSPAVTQSPTTSTITVAPASSSVADQVAAWLGGTTAIGTWNVPNALLAGGVVLGFALLMGGGKKR
jgi:hypothetical protein